MLLVVAFDFLAHLFAESGFVLDFHAGVSLGVKVFSGNGRFHVGDAVDPETELGRDVGQLFFLDVEHRREVGLVLERLLDFKVHGVSRLLADELLLDGLQGNQVDGNRRLGVDAAFLDVAFFIQFEEFPAQSVLGICGFWAADHAVAAADAFLVFVDLFFGGCHMVCRGLDIGQIDREFG